MGLGPTPNPAGAEGQINVPGRIIEPDEPHGEPPEDGDDRVDVTVGSQQQGPNSPSHGAAGGLDVNWDAVAPNTFSPDSTSTGMSTSHPSFGRSRS